MNLSGVGPDGRAGDGVKLPEKTADHLVGISVGAQSIKLRQHQSKRPFHLNDGALRIELPLQFEATLAFDEFFPVEIEEGMEHRIALGTRVGQETRHPIP